ncbi:hypothetical protein KCP76_21610 [Salmonella enterica subsp. enterica serovar Weltevreden]|nr:hypothetical protein KCP76_21610 [Salmonella enterica subsp. enterica serovar Weltevreden]
MVDSRGRGIIRRRHGSMPPRFPVLCGDDPRCCVPSSSPRWPLIIGEKSPMLAGALWDTGLLLGSPFPSRIRYRVRQPVFRRAVCHAAASC